jgi:hypothetical protein
MSEKLNEQDNYILHTAISKINGLEKRTSELEARQATIPDQTDPAEMESHQMLARELLTGQNENSGVLMAIVEELKTIKANVNSQAEQLKVLRSTVEINNSIAASRHEEIKKLILNSPKEVLQQKRILLFPEHNAREYYAVFKWILYIIIAFLSFYLLKYLISCMFHQA